MWSLFIGVTLTIIFVSVQHHHIEAKAVPELERSKLLNFSVDASNYLSCPSTWLEDSTITVGESGTLIMSGTSNVGSSAVPCKINFKRPSADICQVRVDFTSFIMSGPNYDGDCDRASLTVTADNLKDFVACGVNTGQHLYLSYGDCDIVSVNINPNFDTSPAPVFTILATFVSCEPSGNSVETDPAPPGCDQYYRGLSGQVRSFNYVSSPWPMQNQINNEKYLVCIKAPAASKRIVWGACSGEKHPFIITREGYSDDWGAIPDLPFENGANCQTDWVDILGSPYGRYCGGKFPSNVISTTRPFQMMVNFNEEEFPGSKGLINPGTGCSLGQNCRNQYGEIITNPPTNPDDVLPCGSPAANARYEHCSLDPGLYPLVDYYNTGFCLQYQLTN